MWTRPLIVAAVLALALPGAAATRYVDDDGSDAGNDCTVAASPCRTITHGLEVALAGEEVQVAAGTYDAPGGEVFPLALKDGVALIGAGSAESIIDGTGMYPVFMNVGMPLGTGTRLTGFGINNNTVTVAIYLVLGDGDMAPEIDHNVLTVDPPGTRSGIEVDGIDSGRLFAGSIHHNVFVGAYDGVNLWHQWAATTGDPVHPVISDNTFTTCDYPIAYSLAGGAIGAAAPEIGSNTIDTTLGDPSSVAIGVVAAGSEALEFTPIISGNIITGSSNGISASVNNPDPAVVFAPTVAGNSIAVSGESGIMIDGTEMTGDGAVLTATVSDNTVSGAAVADIAVEHGEHVTSATATVTGNTVSLVESYGIYLQGDCAWDELTIADNQIDQAAYGIYVVSGSFGPPRQVEWLVANNHIQSSREDGIIVFPYGTSAPGGAAAWRLVVSGNVVADAGTCIELYLRTMDWDVDRKALISGNTLTGGTYVGISAELWPDVERGAAGLEIRDNLVDGHETGIRFGYTYEPSHAEVHLCCNTITGNSYAGVVVHYNCAGPVELGGGGLSGAGYNAITGNGTFDLVNVRALPVRAQHNWWGSTDPAVIDAGIWDDDEEPEVGEVSFEPFLSLPPAGLVTAELVDVVAVDADPPEASVGDTIQYTATIEVPAEACGDVTVELTVPIPANATLVPGSVTTSRGRVVREDPVRVALGYLPAGSLATVTWRVVAESGQTLVSQGTLTGGIGGVILTDDPDTPELQEPTVTVFDAKQQAAPIPTLGAPAAILLALLLLGAGIALLRRTSQ